MAKITVTGLAQWAKVFEQNRDLLGYQGQWADTDGRCSIEMVLDDDNAKRITASGCMSKGKEDPEARGTIFKFNRKFSTPNDWDGDAPAVYKPDGTKWDYEADGTIGNGSEVLVELDVYKNKGYSTYTTRLERVKVINLVEYNSDGSGKNDPFTANISSSEPAVIAASQTADKAVEAFDEIPF